jgi:transcriptional regulator with XRE-family HTH domain
MVFGCIARSEESKDSESIKALKALEEETGVPAEKLLPKIEKLLDTRFKELLDEHNAMASTNFSVALKLFREDYVAKRIRIFGEIEERTVFKIDDYRFVVIPTVPERNKNSFNPEHCNIASHANGMVVMLACTWIVNEDHRGNELLAKLKELIPSFELSDSEHGNIKLVDLDEGSDMLKSEADQWSWRMSDLPLQPEAQSGR